MGRDLADVIYRMPLVRQRLHIHSSDDYCTKVTPLGFSRCIHSRNAVATPSHAPAPGALEREPFRGFADVAGSWRPRHGERV